MTNVKWFLRRLVGGVVIYLSFSVIFALIEYDESRKALGSSNDLSIGDSLVEGLKTALGIASVLAITIGVVVLCFWAFAPRKDCDPWKS